MTYLERGDIVVRELRESDIMHIVEGEIAQGWEGVTREKYDMRLRHEAEGQCIPLCATYKGEPVGYVNLYFKSYPPMDRGALRYGQPWRRPALRLRLRTADVRQARLHSGRRRCILEGQSAGAVCSVRKRRRTEPLFYEETALKNRLYPCGAALAICVMEV